MPDQFVEDIPAGAPLCWLNGAYIKEIQQGPIRQKVFHGAVVVFTDAVVFIEPPTSERLKSVAKVLGTSLAMGHSLDGLGFATDLAGKSHEQRVATINSQLFRVTNEIRTMGTVSSTDVLSAFGDWAHAWPNLEVSSAKMKMAGIVVKRVSITLKPTSGFSRSFECNRGFAKAWDVALRKAFGSRFQRM